MATSAASLTRLRLIESAERLFAERGINGVSLREIGARAGQRNTGVVRYHFGSRAALVGAILEHRMDPINTRRLALLDQMDAAGRGHEVRTLTEAFVYPLAEMLGTPKRPSWYLRFCVQTEYIEGSVVNDLGREHWTRGMQVVRSRLLERLDHVPHGLRHHRWRLFAMYLAHALAERETVIERERRTPPPDQARFLLDLVDTATDLVLAPSYSVGALPPIDTDPCPDHGPDPTGSRLRSAQRALGPGGSA